MSIRTIIEINHDYLDELRKHPERLVNLLDDLGGATYVGRLNKANAARAPLDLNCGITLVTQRHHSDDMFVHSKHAVVRL